VRSSLPAGGKGDGNERSRATSASGTSCFYTKNGGGEKEKKKKIRLVGGGGFAWLCLVRASLAFKLEDVWWRVKKTLFRH
jgi:hypothetical protein